MYHHGPLRPLSKRGAVHPINFQSATLSPTDFLLIIGPRKIYVKYILLKAP